VPVRHDIRLCPGSPSADRFGVGGRKPQEITPGRRCFDGRREPSATRLGAEPILIPGGHMTLLTDPETVAQALLNTI